MKKILFSLLMLIFLAGCTNLQKQSFNSGANQHIQQIALINPPHVGQVDVVVIRHTGSSFGVVGGLIAVADMRTKTNKYNKLVGTFNWDSYVHQQLASALMNDGYTVKTIKIRPDTPAAAKYLKKYPEVASDALLDYYYTIGQVASGSTTSYVPTVTLHARLVDPRKKSVLYEQHFNAGLPLDKKMSYIPINQEYRNIADLLTNSEQSIEALKQGIQQLTQQLATDLKK